MVLGKLPVPGRPTNWITVVQGPTALAVGAGGAVWTFLLSSILSPSLLETVGWMFFFLVNGPLRQFYSLYQTVSHGEGEQKEK